MALVLTLDHDAVENPLVKGLHKFTATSKFLLVCSVLLDVLYIIDPPNKQFQYVIASFSSIKPLVHIAITALKQLQENPGSNEHSVQSSLQEQGKYHEVHLSEFSTEKKELLENTIANLQKRFPEEYTGIFSKFDILNSTTWSKQISQLRDYGKEALLELAAHFTLLVIQTIYLSNGNNL